MVWNSTPCNYRTIALFIISIFSFGLSFSQAPASGNPVLIVQSNANSFTRYASEILKAQGLNEFDVADIAQLNAATLNAHDVVVLGEMAITPAVVTMLTDWTNAGGLLIAFRPDVKLAPLLGITKTNATLSEKYLLVNTAQGAGSGIVGETIQFHGAADLYTLNGATALATLYSSATTATTNPAVTTIAVGANGGRAVAFTYDLCKSIVYTRQGNPAWAGQKRDGTAGPIRSDDLFYGQNGEPHWIDLNKVAIPQADEQQHLLTNIILQGNLHHKPLPRFWFLPKGYKAAIVMTGDDHNNNATEPRFNQYLAQGSNTPQDVADWKAVRATSYLWLGTPISDAKAKEFEDQGFEIALHLNTGPGGCQDFTAASIQSDLSEQRAQFASKWPSVPPSVTNRNHCISFSDWASLPKAQAKVGIRLDANYYYWPEAWIQNRPGMFTGSGLPMRFADSDGSLIDCYQLTTQIVDEAGINYTTFSKALMDKAVGPEGYYGVFCAQMHTDTVNHAGSDAIVALAKERGIPVIAAKQMLTWLDGRNNSTFTNISWANNQLNFTITKAQGAHGLKSMLPAYSNNSQLLTISVNGTPVPFLTETIKGISYAFFDVNQTGNFIAKYGQDLSAPVISNIVATPNGDGTAVITWTTNEAANSKVDYGSSSALGTTVTNGSQDLDHSMKLEGLQPGITYYFRVTSADAAGNTTTSPAPPAAPLSFTIPAGPCFVDNLVSDFKAGTADNNISVALDGDGAVILKPAINEEFSGSTIPSGWTEGVFNAGGTTVANGSLVVDGTHIYTNNSVTPGSTLEFVATFNQGSFQNIGLSIDQPFNGAPWITIGQGQADGKLYARSSDGANFSLGTGLLGSAHRYRIKWNTSNFEFYVDGNNTPVAKIEMAVATNMYLQISDVNNTDGSLSVDWLRVSPYSKPGEFTSRVFDGGAKKDWGIVSYNSLEPQGSSITINVRTGDTPTPDGTWTSFSLINAGSSVGKSSRYIQYKAILNTADVKATPSLNDISISCTGTNTAPPVVKEQPAAQDVCAGNKAIFTSTAIGLPEPTVQWQSSADGTTWTNITGATSAEYAFVPSSNDHKKQYRAVWTNASGSVNSDPASLTVKPVPVLSTTLTATTTSGILFNYTPVSATTGTSFAWKRAAVNGISNPAVTGAGLVSETLISTSTSPVSVIYNYTLTANGCSNTQDVVVTVNPAIVETPGCQTSASITANFNGISIPAGRYVWFNSVFKAKNVGQGPVNFYVTNSKISYTLNGQLVVLNVPDAEINFKGSALATTTYANGAWRTTVPASTSANVFLTGLSYKLPTSIPANLKNVTWTADIAVDKDGVSFDWKWTAGVYTAFTGNAGLNVKSTDGLLNLLNPLLGIGNAGTPLNYMLNVVPGAMGAGLLNVVSTYSASQSPVCTGGLRPVVQNTTRLETPRIATIVSKPTISNEMEVGIDVKASPNPSNNHFTLQIRAKEGPVTIRILDLVGRTVETHQRKGMSNTVQLGSNWRTGTYFVEVVQGTEKKVVKLIKIN